MRSDVASAQSTPHTSSGRDDLVGRDTECATIDRLIAGMGRRPQGFQVVEIVGDPGIGKSRLLGELRHRAGRNDRLVLAGRAAEYTDGLPFGVLVEALDDHLGQVGSELDDSVDLARCATVFPALSDIVTTVSAADGERYRLHRAIRSLLEWVARGRGLVLILDDVHWADDASRELLDYLLRHPPAASLLVACAYRPRQANAKLTAALARGAEEGLTERIELAPLSRADTTRLLGPEIDKRLRERLHEVSGGNPFYLQALARSGMAAASIVDSSAEVMLRNELPLAVEAALLAELGMASPDARLIAEIAAIVGDPFDIDIVAEAADAAEEEVLTRLDELMALDLVRPARGSRRFAFRHPLVRRIASNSASELVRLGAHSRAAKALERQGASAAMRAHHVERSAQPGDEQAIDVLVQAAEESISSTPAVSAHWLRTALLLLPHDVATKQRRVQLQLLKAHALALVPDLSTSRELLYEVLDQLRPGSADRPRAVKLCAMVERLIGQPDNVRGLLRRELSQLQDPQAPEGAAFKLELALADVDTGQETGGLGLAREALTTARHHGDRALEAAVAAIIAVHQSLIGNVNEAHDWHVIGSAAIEGLHDSEIATQPYALPWLSWSALLLERYEECLRCADRASEMASSGGHGYVISYLLNPRTVALRVVGRLDDAAADAEAVTESALHSPSDGLRATTLCQCCWIALWRGDIDAARRMGEQAVHYGGLGGGTCRPLAAASLVAARMAANDPNAIEDFIAMVGGPELPDVDPLNKTTICEYLAAGEIARGRVDAAEGWAALAERTCPPGLRRRSGHVLLARARVLLARGDAEGAAQPASEAVANFVRVGARYEAGAAQLLAGQAWSAAGQQAQAIAELEGALAIAEACGARRMGEEAARELRRLGRRIPRAQSRSATPQQELTGREREIAELISRGQTSRQIAAELFLSKRTVETHVSHIYAKLGISSRAALATVWADRAAPE